MGTGRKVPVDNQTRQKMTTKAFEWEFKSVKTLTQAPRIKDNNKKKMLKALIKREKKLTGKNPSQKMIEAFSNCLNDMLDAMERAGGNKEAAFKLLVQEGKWQA